MPDLPTNAFDVFSTQEKGHENHLTRALLVLLRLSPLAQEVWLRQIGLGILGLTGAGEPSYAFQSGTPATPDYYREVGPYSTLSAAPVSRSVSGVVAGQSLPKRPSWTPKGPPTLTAHMSS